MAVNKIYIPTFISSVDYQPARVLPHIYFFNGLKDCEPWYIEHYTSSTQNEVTASVQNQFPYFDYYDGLEPTTGSNSLLFFNETPAYGITPTGSLYTNYWDKYVSLLYNPKTRLIDASAIIPLADYFAMELNDIVQWRGNMYHLRAINDYNLKDGTCKLQLLGPIISDSTIAVQPTINCDFNFSSSVYVFPSTTSTTTIPPTTTTLPPTTSTTTAVPTTSTTTVEPTTSTTLSPTTSTTLSPTTSTTLAPTTTTTIGPTTKYFDLTINNNTDITYIGGFGINVSCDLSNTQILYIGEVGACNTMTYNIPPGTSFTSSYSSFPCSNLSVIDSISGYFGFNSSSAYPAKDFTGSLYFDNILTASADSSRGGTCNTATGFPSVSNVDSNLFMSYSLVIDIN